MSTSDDGYGDYTSPTGQTRTRLPDSEDAYGSGRRPRSGLSSRNLIAVVGVVVLLIAAIAFANRGSSSGTTADTADGAPKNGPAAQPTAPTGTDPVEGRNGAIAKGFAKTQQGAQSAAANYAVALNGAGMYTPTERRRIVETVYEPSIAAARKKDLDKHYSNPSVLGRIGLKPDGSAPKGMTFVARAIPAGTKVEAWNGDTAKVSVWYSALFGLAGVESKNPVSEGWYTNTFDLKWTGGDWQVSDVTTKDGPAPVGRDQAAASAEDMSKAVQGFGGFTYAR